MGERRLCTAEVRSSNLLRSTSPDEWLVRRGELPFAVPHQSLMGLAHISS